jgi:hypothetical protein
VAAALSAARVELSWQAVPNASGYRIDAHYGSAEPFHVADLAADQTRYVHFVAPNSAGLTYELSALTGGGQQPLGSAAVALPALEANPLQVQPVSATANPSGAPNLPPLPTLDPLNPDPNVMATLAAVAAGLDPSALLPQSQPVFNRQEIGPAGGVITLTAPNEAQFTLEIPAGALAETTLVYLTPIGDIVDFPFAQGAVAAVQIHPPIRFSMPLTLTIVPPPAAAAVTTGFTVSSYNYELALVPAYAVAGNAYVMDVYWGDTFGLAAATLDEIQAQADRLPSDPGDQVGQQLAALRAFNTDTTPLGETRLMAQLMAGLLQQLAARPAQGAGTRPASLAAPARGLGAIGHLAASGAILWHDISLFDRAISNERQTPADVDDPAFPRELDRAQRTMIMSRLAGEIKAFLDAHKGCRHREDFYAQALVQLLKDPASSFQRLLAIEYASRFGPPEDLKECTYELHIVKSKIEITASDPEGDLIETLVVHSNPFTLKMVGRGIQPALRGAGPITYEQYTRNFTYCPPPLEANPYPAAVLWVTDLRPVFDVDGQLVDFALKGAGPDPLGGSLRTSITTEIDDGVCRIINYSPSGEEPDLWGGAFPSFHNPRVNTDSWTIVGQDSYVATSTVDDFQAAGRTESTTMVLTVTQPGN